MNDRVIEQPHSPELKQLRSICDYLQQHLGLKPFRTEACLFHVGLAVAGQCDALFSDERGLLTIVDWKRTARIRTENPFRSLKEPLENLPESNYWCYSPPGANASVCSNIRSER